MTTRAWQLLYDIAMGALIGMVLGVGIGLAWGAWRW